jgi:phasin
MMRPLTPHRAGLRVRDAFMLLLLLRNMLWAAWWPYSTMLLALEKAAQQNERATRQAQPGQPQPAGPRPQPVQPEPARETPRRQETPMGNDAFIKPEIPEPLRELMIMSIEQAWRAFETFVAISERTWKSLETSSPLGRAGLFALNAKIVEIARRNAEANFALALRLAGAKDLRDAFELQSQHVKMQMETFVKQLEEMRDLAAEIVQEMNPAGRPDAGSARPSPSAPGAVRSGPGGASFASYAPSSSITPGQTGRGY